MSKFNFIYAEDLSHREKTVYIYLCLLYTSPSPRD